MTPNEIEKIFRDEAGRALATLIRLVGDFDLAEDTLAGRFCGGAGTLAVANLPSNPRAWLVNVGRNKAIDRIRRKIAFRGKQQALTHELLLNASAPCETADDAFDDDMLRLILLLPSVVYRGSAGRADAAHGVRAHHGAGRARLSGQRRRDGAAPAARQAENPSRRHPL